MTSTSSQPRQSFNLSRIGLVIVAYIIAEFAAVWLSVAYLHWKFVLLFMLGSFIAGVILLLSAGGGSLNITREALYGAQQPQKRLFPVHHRLIAGLFFLVPGMLSSLAGVIWLVTPLRNLAVRGMKLIVWRKVRQTFGVNTGFQGTTVQGETADPVADAKARNAASTSSGQPLVLEGTIVDPPNADKR